MIILTLDQREAVVDSLRAGVAIEAACKAARTTVATVRAFAADEPTWGVTLAAAEAECAAIQSPVATDATWQDLMARSAELVAAVAPKVTADAPMPSEAAPDAAPRVLAEAAAIAEGRLGSLLWVDARCQMMRPALFGLDRQWVEMFSAFYASKKTVMVCRKGLRAAGSASACRALVRNALFAPRHLDPGTVGVIPIMSSTRDEATDRFVTIRAILQACGISPKKGSDEEVNQAAPGGIGGTYWSTKSQGGGGIIKLVDLLGHDIEFRVLPAMVRHSVGYTGISGFLDESDLWLDDPELKGELKNPADIVFERIKERFTTQPTAELLIFSASYYANSAHARAVANGDTALQFVARLGEEGARLDEVARRGCADLHLLADPRMHAPGDPTSPDIPCWVSNPNVAGIETCYTTKEGDIKKMLALYGGRASEAPSNDGAADARAQILGIRDRMFERVAREGQPWRGPSTDGAHRGGRRAMPWRTGGGTLG